KVYYISNTCAYLLFMAANIAVNVFVPDWLDTWLFLITKFMRFTRFEVSAATSFIIFHSIGFFIIFLAPIRMKYIIEEAKKYNIDLMLDWELNGFWEYSDE
ncbi:MAG: hypothetical protein IJD30_06830, partial [Clostridia bacterium]|nr:hypothetical protein [Clostridia bacterium]